ncbi:MAG: histidine phosphatase family protein [Deltaproteobacteria bacterium]|nr:histidine phosphatase family protein [Deltaproteobacteria bacterium]
MPTWTFVRHGQSVANAEGWLAGFHDAPLTPLGRQQAIEARERLPTPLPPRAYCSDLSRAHETAQLLLEGRGIRPVVAPQLRERDCGAWERRSIASVERLGPTRQRLGSWRGAPPRGESLLAVALRVVGWLTTVDDSDEDALIVCHGALMRSVLAAIDRIPREDLDLWRPGNCEAIGRDVEVGGFRRLIDELRAEAGANHDA